MRHIVKDTATPVFIQKHSLNNFSYSLESIEKKWKYLLSVQDDNNTRINSIVENQISAYFRDTFTKPIK